MTSRRSCSLHLIQKPTYTNMAISQTGKMLSFCCASFYLLFLCVAGINSSTLRLYPEQRYMLPQNRGYFTLNANEGSLDEGGGGAAAAALRLAAGSVTEHGPDSGAFPQHRSRRSAGESALPKVYGQVKQCIPTFLLLLTALSRCRLPFAAEDARRNYARQLF